MCRQPTQEEVVLPQVAKVKRKRENPDEAVIGATWAEKGKSRLEDEELGTPSEPETPPPARFSPSPPRGSVPPVRSPRVQQQEAVRQAPTPPRDGRPAAQSPKALRQRQWSADQMEDKEQEALIRPSSNNSRRPPMQEAAVKKKIHDFVRSLHSEKHTSAKVMWRFLKHLPNLTYKEVCEICSHCQTCIKATARPTESGYSFTLTTSFNDVVYADISYITLARELRAQPWLVMVDQLTAFASGNFLPDAATTSVIRIFEEDWMWKEGVPVVIRTDSGSAFTAKEFFDHLSSECGINIQVSAVDAPYSIGLAEFTGGVLKRLFEKVKEDNADDGPERLLRRAIFYHNSTPSTGSGLSPLNRKLGTLPAKPVEDTRTHELSMLARTANIEGFKGQMVRRQEVDRIIDEERILHWEAVWRNCLTRPLKVDRLEAGKVVAVYFKGEWKVPAILIGWYLPAQAAHVSWGGPCRWVHLSKVRLLDPNEWQAWEEWKEQNLVDRGIPQDNNQNQPEEQEPPVSETDEQELPSEVIEELIDAARGHQDDLPEAEQQLTPVQPVGNLQAKVNLEKVLYKFLDQAAKRMCNWQTPREEEAPSQQQEQQEERNPQGLQTTTSAKECLEGVRAGEEELITPIYQSNLKRAQEGLKGMTERDLMYLPRGQVQELITKFELQPEGTTTTQQRQILMEAKRGNPSVLLCLRKSFHEKQFQDMVFTMRRQQQVPKTLASCEVIHTTKPTEEQFELFFEGIDTEFSKMESLESFKICRRSELPPEYTKLPLQLLLKTKEGKPHCRGTLMGNLDKRQWSKPELFAPTAMMTSFMSIIVRSMLRNEVLFVTDLTGAFLQTKCNYRVIVSPVMACYHWWRRKTGRPPLPHLDNDPYFFLWFIPLYGAKEACALWNKTCQSTMTAHNWETNKVDRCLYRKADNAAVANHVDDFLGTATPDSIDSVEEEFGKMFDLKYFQRLIPGTTQTVRALELRVLPEGVMVECKEYWEKKIPNWNNLLKQLSSHPDTDFVAESPTLNTMYYQVCGDLAFAGSCHNIEASLLNSLAQSKRPTATVADLKILVKDAMENVKKCEPLFYRRNNFKPDTPLKLCVYADAALCELRDRQETVNALFQNEEKVTETLMERVRPQLGALFVLTEKDFDPAQDFPRKGYVLAWGSHKAPSSTASSYSAELQAVQHSHTKALLLQHLFSFIKIDLTIEQVTDNKSVVDSVTLQTLPKHLLDTPLLPFFCLIEAYKRGCFSITWVPSALNLADALTKISPKVFAQLRSWLHQLFYPP
jgi:transposase InsO family protein